MGEVSIPRQPDVVTILSVRNPLRRRAARRIVEATVIGNARPCGRFLRENERLSLAKKCLLDNGFEKVFEEKSGVYKVSVFIREN
ncbi:hypothetical protein ACOI1C_18690 [Bacillus sp. DJP31]|uniref:hypothetical protein n=1 Tax=Bacillus sp. DJP31 TaxID=3409789 RepID=UPI003BB50FCE